MKPEDAPVVQDDGEKFKVGKIYAVKLITGFEFKGIVLAYDPDSEANIVIFQNGTRPERGNTMTTRMVNADFITGLKFLGKLDDDPIDLTKCSIDLDGLEAKEARAIREIERMGVGVTAEAQSIFDALSKTLPVEWDKKDIVVMDKVRICNPYHSDCVTGGTGAASNWVKEVLKLERRKLQLSDSGGK